MQPFHLIFTSIHTTCVWQYVLSSHRSSSSKNILVLIETSFSFTFSPPTVLSITSIHSLQAIWHPKNHCRTDFSYCCLHRINKHNLKLSLESQNFLMQSKWLQPQVVTLRDWGRKSAPKPQIHTCWKENNRLNINFLIHYIPIHT